MTDTNSTTRNNNLLLGATDVTNLGRSGLQQLRTLFESIERASQGNNSTKGLAEIGRNLADDWIDLIEVEFKGIKKANELQEEESITV